MKKHQKPSHKRWWAASGRLVPTRIRSLAAAAVREAGNPLTWVAPCSMSRAKDETPRQEKICWTAISLFVFLVCCQIPVYGVVTSKRPASSPSIRGTPFRPWREQTGRPVTTRQLAALKGLKGLKGLLGPSSLLSAGWERACVEQLLCSRGFFLGATLLRGPLTISLYILIQPYLYKHFAKYGETRTYKLIMRGPLSRGPYKSLWCSAPSFVFSAILCYSMLLYSISLYYTLSYYITAYVVLLYPILSYPVIRITFPPPAPTPSTGCGSCWPRTAAPSR